MKKIFLLVMCIINTLLFCSCSSNSSDIRIGGDNPDEISVESMIGSLEEVPYENIMDMTNFKLAFDNYTDPEK